ncbi:hypothetical protein SUGI_1227650 [Cryptomeria japonica]|uniref:Secreted protein n=1 Tax=Cryptomeria japonica TaxID=3369 RepID=A0AAD3NQ15_CRYJA|nr:hypothetical protein SUGI_1227650 [Cryptomeria japonica]
MLAYFLLLTLTRLSLDFLRRLLSRSKYLPEGRAIFRCVIDEGALTCVMSLACWKALGSLEIVPSTTMLKAFYGHSFKPHGIIPSSPSVSPSLSDADKRLRTFLPSRIWRKPFIG